MSRNIHSRDYYNVGEFSLLDHYGTDVMPVMQEDENSQAKAASMKMFGKLTRETVEWHPDKLLCKRFNVANPYPEYALSFLLFLLLYFSFFVIFDILPSGITTVSVTLCCCLFCQFLVITQIWCYNHVGIEQKLNQLN